MQNFGKLTKISELRPILEFGPEFRKMDPTNNWWTHSSEKSCFHYCYYRQKKFSTWKSKSLRIVSLLEYF